MTNKPYGMICPTTRACEILEPRWTIPILVGLWAGASKFNEIRREIGSISPALLSRRLKELQALGLIERIEDRASGEVTYIRTEAAIALEPALDAIAHWAQRYISAELLMCSVSVSNLMWNARKRFVAEELPKRRVVVQFRFDEADLDYDTYWAIAKPGAPVEICSSIPGFDIDVYIETPVKPLYGVMLGRTTFAREIERDRIFVSGDAAMTRTIDRWFGPMPYGEIDGVLQLGEEGTWDRTILRSA
jgi:DNA-binding HxlR family transcriptional regulator